MNSKERTEPRATSSLGLIRRAIKGKRVGQILRDFREGARAFAKVRNWREFIGASFPESPGIGEIVFRNGVRVKIRPRQKDRDIVREIWLLRTYNPSGFRIGRRDIVMDIGAHIGAFTLLAATAARDGKVYSVEPADANFALLEENLRVNGIKNAVAHRVALSGSEGTKKLFLSKENTGGGSFYDSFSLFGSPAGSVDVPGVTLSKFMEKNGIDRVDFMKIDCEGAEYEILMGGGHETLAKVRRIAMEYHNIDAGRTGTALAESLKKAGFEVRLVPGSKDLGMLYAVRAR